MGLVRIIAVEPLQKAEGREERCHAGLSDAGARAIPQTRQTGEKNFLGEQCLQRAVPMALRSASPARRRQLEFGIDSASPAKLFRIQTPLRFPFAHAQAKPDKIARFPFDAFQARCTPGLLRHLLDCRLVRFAVLLVAFQRFEELLAVLVIGLFQRHGQRQEREFAADLKPLEDHVRKLVDDAYLGLNAGTVGTVQQVVAQ